MSAGRNFAYKSPVPNFRHIKYEKKWKISTKKKSLNFSSKKHEISHKFKE